MYRNLGFGDAQGNRVAGREGHLDGFVHLAIARFSRVVALQLRLDRLARCRAVVFPPLQEDYGFVTVEAFASRKAVVTCKDSGGPAELVTDGVNGLVCDPTPESIAAALRKVADDEGLAERLGAGAFQKGAELNWPDAVRQLTA